MQEEGRASWVQCGVNEQRGQLVQRRGCGWQAGAVRVLPEVALGLGGEVCGCGCAELGGAHTTAVWLTAM